MKHTQHAQHTSEETQTGQPSLTSTLDSNALETAQQLVRDRAYYLWEAAGSPLDRDPQDFWLQAEQEYLTQGQAAHRTMSASANSAE